MASSSGKKARKQMYEDVGYQQQPTQRVQTQKFPKLVPKTYKQEDLLEAMETKDIVFALGSAGSGKTFCQTHYAAEQLYYKKIDKIILTRPASEAAGEELGFMPGDLLEKFSVYIAPYMETLNELLGKSFVEYCMKTGIIEPVPLGFMRGRSFKNCLILADEMQSATPIQMKLLLTRLGENSKVFINGDVQQRDETHTIGLEDAIGVLHHLKQVEVIQFTDEDCVRSGTCRDILRAYSGFR
jgi:phosphate starvation-inducible PhoH-like protein